MISSVLLILLEAEIVFCAGRAQLRRREKKLNRSDEIYTQVRSFSGAFGDFASLYAGENDCAGSRRDERA
jgi:hypothetical protein